MRVLIWSSRLEIEIVCWSHCLVLMMHVSDLSSFDPISTAIFAPCLSNKSSSLVDNLCDWTDDKYVDIAEFEIKLD